MGIRKCSEAVQMNKWICKYIAIQLVFQHTVSQLRHLVVETNVPWNNSWIQVSSVLEFVDADSPFIVRPSPLHWRWLWLTETALDLLRCFSCFSFSSFFSAEKNKYFHRSSIPSTNREEYRHKCSINDWGIHVHPVAYHYQMCLKNLIRIFRQWFSSTYYFLFAVYWWISSVVMLLFVVYLWRSYEINQRDRSEDFLSYSSVSNDNSEHVLEMVYKNKELEAPNYNNTYYQTKKKPRWISICVNFCYTYIYKTEIMFICCWLNDWMASGIRWNSMTLRTIGEWRKVSRRNILPF